MTTPEEADDQMPEPPGERLLERVTREYALGGEPLVVGAPARGELGQVWRLQTSSGTWALKEILAPEPEGDAAASASLQEAALAAGVPAPAVVRTAEGRVVLDVAGRQFRVYSWVDVRAPDPQLDPTEVGRLLASIHLLERPSPGPASPWYTEPVGTRTWERLAARLKRARMPFGDWLDSMRPELSALESLLVGPARLQQLHLDLWADNVRATTAGGLCVLDWENAGAGDPSQELAVVLFEFCSWDPARARALYSAYVDAGGSGRVVRAEDFSMAVAQLGHILEWQCRNWLRHDSPARRRHAEEAIGEFVTRPLTREVTDGLVDAVAGIRR